MKVFVTTIALLIAFSAFWWTVFSTVDRMENQLIQQVMALKDTQTKLALDLNTLNVIMQQHIHKGT